MTRSRATIRGALIALAIAAAGCMPSAPPAPPLLSATIVDLSHAFDSRTIVWPTSAPFQLTSVADGVTAAGYYYAANDFASSEHGGTHLDAPVHFAQGQQTVDAIPLDRLVGEAFVLDVTAAAARDRDYEVTVEDVRRAEQEQGAIPSGAILLIRTGYSQRWPDAAAYLGTAARGPGAVAQLHFPGLHPDAARWLLANRSIDAIGIDTASIDRGHSTGYESHRALFARNVPAFENLTGLERLPPRGATVVALPMKIGGGSGGPLRAVAFLP